MTHTISATEHRAVKHEKEVRASIELATVHLDEAESHIILDADPADIAGYNRIMALYAAVRRHLNSARDVLAP